MEQSTRTSISLLSLRVSVFVVMFMWTIDKVIRPAHAASVYERYYSLSLDHTVFYVLFALEMALIVTFLFGIFKTLTYGLVLLFHAISTLSSFNQYLAPFTGPHLLFFAAWPMLAACFTLFLLRDLDRYSLGCTGNS